MNNIEIVETIKDIVIDILDVDEPDSFELTSESMVKDYPKWDSLAHINIITQLEAVFSIRFSLDEIEEFESIKNIIQIIMLKI